MILIALSNVLSDWRRLAAYYSAKYGREASPRIRNQFNLTSCSNTVIQPCYDDEPSLSLPVAIPSPSQSILNMAIISTLISYFAPILYVAQSNELNYNLHPTHDRNRPASYFHRSHHTRTKSFPSIEPELPPASPSIYP